MVKARKVPSEREPVSASQPPKPITATCPRVGRASSVGFSRAVIRAARMRSANSRPAARSRVATSRASCPKPLTTRTPVTVSSTCWAMSAARCWADQVAGNSPARTFVVTSTAAGSMTSATTASSGDSQNIATTDTTTMPISPALSGTIDSRPCTSCRSVMARDTTCPVRSASWRCPSSRCTAPKTSRRRSCCTLRASRPARYRRRKAAPNPISASPTSAATRNVSRAVEPATASSTASLVSSGTTACRASPSTETTSAPTATPRCRRQAPVSRRIQPGASGVVTPPR